MMTKKDFVTIAQALVPVVDNVSHHLDTLQVDEHGTPTNEYPLGYRNGAKYAIEQIAGALEEINPNFDRGLFFATIGWTTIGG